MVITLSLCFNFRFNLSLCFDFGYSLDFCLNLSHDLGEILGFTWVDLMRVSLYHELGKGFFEIAKFFNEWV